MQTLYTLSIIVIKLGRKERSKVKETTCLTKNMLVEFKAYWYPVFSFHREATFSMLCYHSKIKSGKELQWNDIDADKFLEKIPDPLLQLIIPSCLVPQMIHL
jgi:hypothetical protein